MSKGITVIAPHEVGLITRSFERTILGCTEEVSGSGLAFFSLTDIARSINFSRVFNSVIKKGMT
jgi:hypothetical protein